VSEEMLGGDKEERGGERVEIEGTEEGIL